MAAVSRYSGVLILIRVLICSTRSFHSKAEIRNPKSRLISFISALFAASLLALVFSRGTISFATQTIFLYEFSKVAHGIEITKTSVSFSVLFSASRFTV